mmetsp:Transcript_59924/g.134666  ORF Transcript_59924/g.134666 Transcript_59924/m.134666 type:complete len:241 (-) Transcript_59924:152-874(-)
MDVREVRSSLMCGKSMHSGLSSPSSSTKLCRSEPWYDGDRHARNKDSSQRSKTLTNAFLSSKASSSARSHKLLTVCSWRIVLAACSRHSTSSLCASSRRSADLPSISDMRRLSVTSFFSRSCMTCQCAERSMICLSASSTSPHVGNVAHIEPELLSPSRSRSSSVSSAATNLFEWRTVSHILSDCLANISSCSSMKSVRSRAWRSSSSIAAVSSAASRLLAATSVNRSSCQLLRPCKTPA